MSGFLKPLQYYVDLYDRYTVERCRNLIRIHSNPLKNPPLIDGKEPSTEMMDYLSKMAVDFALLFETGERYLEKEKRIREWMEADQERNWLYDTAQAPGGIRCLTCHSLLKPAIKEFWSELDKPDRIFFMYDCPNKCLPGRAFFSDGEEWRAKRDICPSCNADLGHGAVNTGKNLVTKYACTKCDYVKTDEYEWHHKEEDPIDEDFVRDRERFCLTKERGKKYQDEKWGIERMGRLAAEWKEKASKDVRPKK